MLLRTTKSLNKRTITNIESGETITVEISGMTANLLYATDGYVYNMMYWTLDG